MQAYVKYIFYKIMSGGLKVTHTKQIQHDLHEHTNRVWQQTKFHPNQQLNLQEYGHNNFVLVCLCLCLCVCVCVCVCVPLKHTHSQRDNT